MFVEQFPTRQLRIIAGALFDALGKSLAWSELPDDAFREGLQSDAETRLQPLSRIRTRLQRRREYALQIDEAAETVMLELL
jgi:hypothetical protein